MRLWTAMVLLVLTTQTAQLTIRDGVNPPMCAVRCWENSKFLGRCVDDDPCLCNEAYENAVFQCLYAQCDSTLSGSAFLHTVSKCARSIVDLHMVTPPLASHDELRKREVDFIAGLTSTFGSLSTGSYLAHNTQVFATDSAGSFPTQSVGNGYTSTTASVAGQPTPVNQGNATIPAMTSNTAPHASSSQGLGVSAVTSTALVYTGASFHFYPSLGIILVAFAMSYVAA